MTTKPMTKDHATEDRAIQAAGAARDAAERRLTQAYAALNAATPAGAGVAVVTLRVLQLRAEVEEAEAGRDDALRRVRAAAQTRADRIISEYAAQRRARLARLLELAEPVLAEARALRREDEAVASSVELLPPEFPLPALLGPDPLGPLRRMLSPLATVAPALPPPVPAGCVRVRALARIQDRERCGALLLPGDVWDFEEDVATDLMKHKLAEPVA